jgi:hypothetical protein
MSASDATPSLHHHRTHTYSAQIAASFSRFKAAAKYNDVSVHSNGKNYPCHRILLAASSPVLEAMLDADMAESRHKEIKLNSIPPAVLECLVHYIYSGETDVPDDLLLPAVQACDFLQLTELRDVCLRRSLTTLNASNVISWFRVAEALACDELKTKCVDLLASSLAAVAQGSEFLELSVAEVSSYLSDAQRCEQTDPDHLLDAAMAWINHNAQHQQPPLITLMHNLDLGACSVECLEEQTDKYAQLLDSQPSVSRVLMKGIMQAVKQQPIRQTRSKGKKSVMAVLGGHPSNISTNPVCWYGEPQSQQLQELTTIPGKCSMWLSVCTVAGGFVVTGGDGSDQCSMYMSVTKAWTQLASLLAPRHRHASISVDRKILVLGGLVSASKSSSVHSLDIDGGVWKEEPALPDTVRYPEAARVDSTLYVMNTYHKNQLYQQDPVSKTWRRKAKCPERSCLGARMTAVRGRLYVTGGNAKLFWCYDTTTDTWTAGQAPLLQHDFGALVFLDDKLVLIGGHDEDGAEEYDFTTGSWSLCAFKVPHKLCNLHAVALDM